MTLTKQIFIGVTVVSLIYELINLIFSPKQETAEAKSHTCSARTQEKEEEGPSGFHEKSTRVRTDEEETSAGSKFQSPRGCNDASTRIHNDEDETSFRSIHHSVEDVGTTIECIPGGNVKYTISSKYLDGLVETNVRSSHHSDNEGIGMTIECTPQGNVKFTIPLKYLDGIQTEPNTNTTAITAEDDRVFEISLDADQGSQDQLRRIFLEADLLHESRGLDADNNTKELILTILSDALKYRQLQQAAAHEASNSEASTLEILEEVSYSDLSSMHQLLAEASLAEASLAEASLAEASEEASYSDLSSSMY